MSDDLLEVAQLGVEAESFKSSRLGKYMVESARDEILDASEKLCTVNPDDRDEIERLQNKVYRANSFITWLSQLIEDGNFVIQEMRDEE